MIDEGTEQMSFNVESLLQEEVYYVKNRTSGIQCGLAKQEACDEAEMERIRQARAQTETARA